ncbi:MULTISPECIES: ImmA/IrrE family metallo-endopeptidase [Bacillaceae]|uniref:ImmA/IrrE family metallo-endopeptidase n=1 Tax=Bacillaceae TaxID=186817 RepID=UPI0005A94E2C|nr:ImmA/IrrE family metallo-endopeptidase [Bacillus rubiinfantis]
MQTTKKIEQKANELLKMFEIDEIPIPVYEIANNLGIIVQEEELEGEMSGILLRDIDKTIIGVNSKHYPNRKRFTIAHELGHFVMHKGNPVHIDRTFRVNFRDKNSSLANNIDEIEANAFAAALLMPEKKIKQVVNKKLKQGIDIEESDELASIADMFKVSKQSLLIRLFKLGLIEDLGI